MSHRSSYILTSLLSGFCTTIATGWLGATFSLGYSGLLFGLIQLLPTAVVVSLLLGWIAVLTQQRKLTLAITTCVSVLLSMIFLAVLLEEAQVTWFFSFIVSTIANTVVGGIILYGIQSMKHFRSSSSN